MRNRLNEAYFLTMAKLFGSILLALCIVVAGIGIWNGPPPTADELYGCTVQQQAPNGDCP